MTSSAPLKLLILPGIATHQGVLYDVELRIDVPGLLRLVGTRAAVNRIGRSRALKGCVIARIVGFSDSLQIPLIEAGGADTPNIPGAE